jgi:hypothetical protein
MRTTLLRQKGTMIIHHLRKSGLCQPDQPDNLCIYLRQDVIDLWNKLDISRPFRAICGPPGVGKSVATWAWALNRSETQVVLWFHFTRSTGFSGVLLHEGKGEQISTLLKKDDLYNVLWRLQHRGDILILDGITEEERKFFMDLGGNWQKLCTRHQVIYVTSDQFSLRVEDAFPILHCYSWTLEELKEACEYDEFFQSIKQILFEEDSNDMVDSSKELAPEVIHQRLDEKYALAGGSTRYMFGFSETKVQKDILLSIQTCGKDIVNLLDGTISSNSRHASNHLLSRYKDQPSFILSKWASYQMLTRANEPFLKIAKSFGEKNHALDGWIFELEFLYRLRVARDSKQELKFHDDDDTQNSPFVWFVPRLIEFKDYDSLIERVQSKSDQKCLKRRRTEFFQYGTAINKKKIKLGDWLIPATFNQGCYDFAQICSTNHIPTVSSATQSSSAPMQIPAESSSTQSSSAPMQIPAVLRLVQVTRAKNHDLKIHEALGLVETLRDLGFSLQKTEVVFVVPVGSNFVAPQKNQSTQLGKYDQYVRYIERL